MICYDDDDDGNNDDGNNDDGNGNDDKNYHYKASSAHGQLRSQSSTCDIDIDDSNDIDDRLIDRNSNTI